MHNCSVAVPFQQVQYRVHEVSCPKMPYSQSQWSVWTGPSKRKKNIDLIELNRVIMNAIAKSGNQFEMTTHLLTACPHNNLNAMDNHSLRSHRDVCQRTLIRLDSHTILVGHRCRIPSIYRNSSHRRQRVPSFCTDPLGLSFVHCNL